MALTSQRCAFVQKHDILLITENNMLSSHSKRSQVLCLNNKLYFLKQKNLCSSEIVWYFTGVYIIK